MKTNWTLKVSAKLAKAAMLLSAIAILSVAAVAEEPAFATLTPEAIEPGISASPTLPEAPQPHRFWDTHNTLLFAGVAAANTADFVVTRQNLQNGGKELNPITRAFAGSTATLALNFAGETAATMALSYVFHRTGHHRLESITSAVAMSISTQAVIYSGTHR